MEYCQELYKENGANVEAARQLENIAPSQEESDDTLLESEVKKAIRYLKKGASSRRWQTGRRTVRNNEQNMAGRKDTNRMG